MITMFTCKSGVNLINKGEDCSAWNDHLLEIGEYMLEVDEAAIKKEKQECGEYYSYIINPTLGKVKIIRVMTAADIEKLMVD